MERILLIRPSDRVPSPEDVTYEHLGLGYLSAYLQTHGIEVDTWDLVQQPKTDEEFLRLVATGDYSVVGVTASYQDAVPPAVEVARLVKQARPDLHVCFGGHFPTASHDLMLRDFPDIDSVVRGEGESPFLEVARRLGRKQPLDGVKGLTHRRAAEVVVEEPASSIPNLDDLPFPDRGCLPDAGVGIRYASLESSRGCQFRCTFCSIENFYGPGNWRARTVENIVDEMCHLYEHHGCRGFYFADDNFVAPGDAGTMRVLEFCIEVHRRGLTDISLAAMLSASCVNDQVVKALVGIGLSSVLVGVESGSERVLRRMRKAATPETNSMALRLLRQYDIDVTAAFIMFDPESTIEDVRDNLTFLESHLDCFSDCSLINPLSVYYGTQDYIRLSELGLLSGGYLNPKYEFLVPDIAWLCTVSAGLLKPWMRILDDEGRGRSNYSSPLPPAERKRVRQRMLAEMIDVMKHLTTLAEHAAGRAAPEETVEQLMGDVNGRLEALGRLLCDGTAGERLDGDSGRLVEAVAM